MSPTDGRLTDDQRWRAVQARIGQLGQRPDGLIEVMHAAQEAFGYLDHDVLAAVGAALGVPLSQVYGVATFYSHFTLAPHGAHTCVVCTGTACHISGGAAVLAAGHAAAEARRDTSLSVLTTRCPGTCSLAPMVLVDGVAIGPVTADQVAARLAAL